MSRVSYVKGQYNKPKDRNGNLVGVMSPCDGYALDDLLCQAYSRGWESNFFSEPDSPTNFPYWDVYLTGENGPLTYVSIFGEVACCFDRYAAEQKFKVLDQQWNKQFVPTDTDERAKRRQKYLYVYFNNSPYYNVTHTGLLLHSMVGLVHSPICLDDAWWDERKQLYRLKSGLNWDHLDKDKANNSVYNLNGISSIRNKVMVDWSVEQKMQFFRDTERLAKEDRDRLLIKQ